MSNQPLFTPYRIGDLDLPNRIVMAPLTRMRAPRLPQFAENAPLAEVDWDTVYASGPHGYSDYPTYKSS
jgi:2,4-dienoyl-CoA reductase-like NADH-dependent reductase (Old Yellow Enzyme family)